MTPVALYTIGHSDRPIGAFLEILRRVAIHTLVDIRNPSTFRPVPPPGTTKVPSGSRCPPYRLFITGPGDNWATSVNPEPRHRMSHSREDSAGSRTIWIHRSLRAASQLLKLPSRSPTGMLCAEMNPEECHRQLLADYLLLQGAIVIHRLDLGARREHVLHPRARHESAALVDDAGASARLPLDSED